MTTRTFETRVVAQLMGTNRRRVAGWVEKGIVTPHVAGGGKGSRRAFDMKDIARLAVYCAVQRVVGEQDPVARLTVETIEPAIDKIADQLARGEIESPDKNALVIEVDAAHAAGNQVDVWFPLDGEALEAVTQAAGRGNPVIVVPRTICLGGLVERREE